MSGKLTSWLSAKSLHRLSPVLEPKKPTPEIDAKIARYSMLAALNADPKMAPFLNYLNQRLIGVLSLPRIVKGEPLDVYNAEIEGRKKELLEILNELRTAGEQADNLNKEYYGGNNG